MPNLRRYADVLAQNPTEAEEKLIEACKAGEPCILGDGTCPDAPSPECTIRADILRYLILGGCEECPVDGIGVWLIGGYVEGPVDIDYEPVKGALQLENCHFDSRLDSVQSRIEMVDLSGSRLKGWFAQGAKIEGSVFLRNATASATIDLNSATIGGQLECSDAQLNAAEGLALNAQGAEIKGDVFLRNATASATIRLNSATIGGDLNCSGAKLNAADGPALFGQSMTAGGLIWWDVEVPHAYINLTSAHISDIADDIACWPTGVRLFLDGLTYDRLHGRTDAASRITWVKRGCYRNGEFFPQPFTQLAKVLREIGHDSDGQKVLTQREHLRLRHRRHGLRLTPNGDWSVAFLSLWRDLRIAGLWLWHMVFRYVAGYGHRPFRSIAAMGALFLMTAIPAHLAYDEGSMAPNSGPVLVSDRWIALAEDPNVTNPAAAWSASVPGKDWESFSPVAYAFDVVIPIIDFGQTDAWSPSTEREDWGQFLFWWRWVMTACGWIVTALGAAAVTSVIRRE